jgi:hypothetical protein
MAGAFPPQVEEALIVVRLRITTTFSTVVREYGKWNACDESSAQTRDRDKII